MEPSTGLDFGSVYTTIGSALGTPVALVIFLVVSKIKEHPYLTKDDRDRILRARMNANSNPNGFF